MANNFPSTSYACPCSDLTSVPLPATNRRASFQPSTVQLSEDQALNPHSPRADYALYPLDHLLYCDECDALRCPRCWTEEILYWYCPMCLFEVPSSAVRGDGNRCTRSCFSCPSCTSQLAVAQITNGDNEEGLLKPDAAAVAASDGSYVLQCHYCGWNSLAIGVQFSKPTKISEQMTRIRKARQSAGHEESSSDSQTPTDEDLFSSLSSFYKSQLTESNDSPNPYSNSPYSSPANLARIMSLYGGLPYNALKKSREKPQPMREALKHSEGLVIYTASDFSEAGIIEQLQKHGWASTISSEQRYSSPVNYNAKSTDDLWPAATPLRTRRGRRCRTCRQYLSRPDTKVGSMKYRIRLLAINYIPRLAITALKPQLNTPVGNSAFHLRPTPLQPERVRPLQPKHYILTVRNPLFETVRISLATSAVTPGRLASRVTILCPSFAVGPAGEIWDDALASSGPAAVDGGRSAAMASLTGSSETLADRQPEAGKVWEKTRNSTSVILEIVPSALRIAPSIVPADGEETDVELDEDDDVLEVPIYVRAEWEAEVKAGENISSEKGVDKEVGEKIPKELGYWVVLSVARISDAGR